MFEYNSTDYLVEVGTYVPLKIQLQDLKNAGVNLMAMRQARADLINAVDKDGNFLGFDDIENFEDVTKDMSNDEIDVLRMRLKYRELMANKQFADLMSGKVPEKEKIEEPVKEKLDKINSEE